MSNFNKISGQRGTLLVEAIAMLGLIALVTPTLYKKSAERLQEIQDINTASQARTMYNIVETFMKTNYSALMDATSSASNNTVAIGYQDGGSSCAQQTGGLTCFDKGYSSFVPYGFTPGDLKNYSAPNIYVHRDKDSLVSYIIFPALSGSDIGKKRAARVASLVGANGGVVSQPFGNNSSSSEIYGTGGAWRLDSGMLSDIKMDDNLVENSLVVTSPEPINMSNMDSEKFLYRVPPDDDGKDFHNQMVTDLYLGGNEDHETNWQTRADEYFSIFNVRKLTLNTNCARRDIAESTTTNMSDENYCNPNVADLYIGKPNNQFLGKNPYSRGVGENTGAAWIYGNLSALKENFRLFREGDEGASLEDKVNRTNGFDVMEFVRRGDTSSGAETESDFKVFRAENPQNNARVSLIDGFLQVFQAGSSAPSSSAGEEGSYEFMLGQSSYVGGVDGLMHAYYTDAGSSQILRLNSPSEMEGSPDNFITMINRAGGVVYINGGPALDSSSNVKMETVINDAGGKLTAGHEGSWIYAADTGNSAAVYILNGRDATEAGDKREFFVGGTAETSSGTMIYGNQSRVSLRGGLLRVHSTVNNQDSSDIGGMEMLQSLYEAAEMPSSSLTGETAILSKYTDILGSTYMGAGAMGSSGIGGEKYTRMGYKLGVAGNAWIDNLLMARNAWFDRSGFKELHAGFSSYADYSSNPHAGWLDVYDDRFIVRDKARSIGADGADDSTSVMIYADSSVIVLRDLEGAKLEMAQGTAFLGNERNRIFADSSDADSSSIRMIGSTLANIYTDDSTTAGVVNLQQNALQLFGQPNETGSYGNRVEARAQEFMIQTKGDGTQDSSTAQFYATEDEIRTRYVNFSVENDQSSAVFRVMPNAETGSSDANVQVHGTLHVNNNDVIHVASDVLNRAGIEGENRAMLEVDPEYVQVWASAGGSTYAARTPSGTSSDYYAMVKINPSDINGGSSATTDTENASVYIRRGAIELEPSTEGVFTDAAADQGVGYIKANRLVSDTGLTVPAPTTISNQASGYTHAVAYDQYMVNPAYTSVMHDIKLTTRGGARLSDALPDFVLKGVYNLINNCQEGDHNGPCTGTDMGRWASPYIGKIPYASCPPGYRNMATVVPISFNMGQAGQVVRSSLLGKSGTGGNGWVVNPYARQAQILNAAGTGGIAYPPMAEVQGYTVNSVWSSAASFATDFSATTQTRTEGWFRGFKAVHEDTSFSSTTSKMETVDVNTPYDNFQPWRYLEDTGSDWKIVAEPLYFQQNTWLKTSVDPGTEGWAAYMGFLYDTSVWSGGDTTAPVRSNYNDKGYNDNSGNTLATLGGYAWNVFPIPTNTLEGHATVYCYFDRKNFTGWGDMVDQIDQLNNYRAIGVKDSNYSKRLDDPSLKYSDPW